MKIKSKKLPITPFHERFKKNESRPEGAALTDNRIQRAKELSKHYFHLSTKCLTKGVSPINFLRVVFPHHIPVANVPPSVHIEFTNACNLKCTYCSSPLPHRQKGIMSEMTFSRIESDLIKFKIDRVCVVGNGEALLHPNFSDYIERLNKAGKFITLTSNYNKVSKEQAYHILKNVDILNISVDGGDELSYEKSRKGGNFNKLISNLIYLKEEKRKLKSKCLVNIRLMVRPSHLKNKSQFINYWQQYADEVSIQYIVDIVEEDDDVFGLNCSYNNFPKCSMPFKMLSIHWDGEVPLCTYTFAQAKNPSDYVLGNINSQDLSQLWNSSLIKQYRWAHKNRDKEKMPLCNGCGGC